ncbi:MAG: hypothetical protein DRQ51_07000 [Gammaproteobacteria bacterium]|nr:MAG: hypothetical protein DRQ51_07000 [Gammaproteobacteria bacterium]
MKKNSYNIDSWYESSHSLTFKQELNKKIMTILKNLTQNQHKLQLGLPQMLPKKDKIYLINPNKRKKVDIVSGFEQLSVFSKSADLIIVPHTHQNNIKDHLLFAEIDRILSNRGFLIVYGFNPYGFFSIKNSLSIKKNKINYQSFSINRLEHNLIKYGIIKQDEIMIDTHKHSIDIKALKDVYLCLFQKKTIPLNPITNKKSILTDKNLNPSF